MTTLTDRPVPVPLGARTPLRQPPIRPARRSLRTLVAHHRRSLAWLLPTLFLAAIVQAVNLGGSPQRNDDEGTYTAQAWAISHLGQLAHYTYWYDHPPLGWIQIAAYTTLTGGFDRYDFAVVAAREAMVVAALISVVLLWAIARRIGLSRPAAAAAGILFAVSPLAVQFHRTVYLDNVATPWLLASILLALTRRHQLAGFTASAAALGIAVLSKETYLLALPLVAVLMWRNARPETRRFTLPVAATTLTIIGAAYLLFAALKGELVPGPDRVSLWGAISFQLGTRDSSGSILDPASEFSRTLGSWFELDMILLALAPVAAVSGLFVRRLRPYAAMSVFLMLVMFRPGGYLPVPYVIMMLPFMTLLIAGVTDAAVRSWVARRGIRRLPNLAWLAIVVFCGAALVPSWAPQLRTLLATDVDDPAQDAEEWAEENLPRDSRLIVDNSMWVDFVEAGFPRENVVWFYKVDTDPAVLAVSPDRWRDFDYVLKTSSMSSFSFANAPSAVLAVENSTVVAAFSDGGVQVEVRRIHPEGMDAAAATIQTEVDQRTALGSEVSANAALAASATDRAHLGAGEVDARISVLLDRLLADGHVSVGELPMVAGEEQSPLRRVLLTEVDGRALVRGGELTDAGEQVLSSAPGASAPESAVPTDDGLLLTYPVEAPSDLAK